MRGENKGLAVIVQCRLSSSRLPKKAIKDLGGRTVLEWTLASMKKVPAEFYYVATDEDSYETLAPICKKSGYEIFAGPLDDVLERYCLLIEKIKCRVVLRATADNPFLFYEAANLLCEEFEKQSRISKIDYMTWTGLPHGSGVEVFSADSLLKARKLTDLAYDHEHVSPSLYGNKNVFSSLFYKAPARFLFPEYRTTIDTPGDYKKALSVVNRLSMGKFPAEPYTTEQILSAVKNPDVSDTIIFIPSIKKGQGTGHLRRCLNAAWQSGGFVYVPENPELEEAQRIVSDFLLMHKDFKPFQIVNRLPEEKEYSLIVTDLFSAEKSFFHALWKKGNVLSIDEGSAFTENADFLLDIIPSYGLERKSNVSKTEFIERPLNRKLKAAERIEKILISFGGEDSSGFTEKAASYFRKSGLDVTVIKPSSPVLNLKEKLFEYDLVVTHYGLTAFEAMSAGVNVLMFPVSKLHEKLSKKYGFALFDIKDLDKPFDSKYLDLKKTAGNEEVISRNEENLGGFIKGISHAKRYFCPICAEFPEKPDSVVFRTRFRTFRRCRNCGMVYISFSTQEETVYKKEYFAEEYKNQYGKTYLEDFASIKKSGLRRMSEINLLCAKKEKSKPSLLDVGCAYGPFLSAAMDEGWLPFGTDISQDAVNYVQNTLLIPAVKSQFPDFDSEKEFGISSFDAVSMWFVIEHFKDLKTVLEKVSSILKKGGIFAFSTPSGEGVSALKNTETFFEQSPKDHYSIWEPSETKKILKRFGFKVLKTVSTGHHPERFPLAVKKSLKKGSGMFSFLQFYSELNHLGDTFEVYCRKE